MHSALGRSRCLVLLSSGLSHYKGAALPRIFQRKDVDCVMDPAGMGLPTALECVSLLQYKSSFPVEIYYWIQMAFETPGIFVKQHSFERRSCLTTKGIF